MEFRTLIITWWQDLLSVVFPQVCEVCGRQLVDGEELLCTHCNIGLPRTGYHMTDFNDIHQRIALAAPVDRAASWFHYKRQSPYTELILRAKYFDRPEIAQTMGRLYAREIESSGFFSNIDVLLPVPMHRWKQLKRGYNQAEMVCRGINEVIGIPIGDNLVALHGHKSQTKRGAYERYLNVSGLFGVINSDELCGRHVLVVDDVLTTGSTMSACCKVLADTVENITISVITLAAASRL